MLPLLPENHNSIELAQTYCHCGHPMQRELHKLFLLKIRFNIMTIGVTAKTNCITTELPNTIKSTLRLILMDDTDITSLSLLI